MSRRPVESPIPPNSRITARLSGASFHDSWCVTSSDVTLSALDHFIAVAKKTPQWVNACMVARNLVGQFFGLKDLGKLSDLDMEKPTSSYQPGDRVGIFTMVENAFDEALIGDDDKHLNVVLSIHRKECAGGAQVVVTVTTVVHVKNLLGHLYMLPVKPMHRIIAPAVLAGMVRPAPAA
ncbi:MAG: DUF2867 domain-containing protein [Giesbergeria sp.]